MGTHGGSCWGAETQGFELLTLALLSPQREGALPLHGDPRGLHMGHFACRDCHSATALPIPNKLQMLHPGIIMVLYNALHSGIINALHSSVFPAEKAGRVGIQTAGEVQCKQV